MRDYFFRRVYRAALVRSNKPPGKADEDEFLIWIR